MLFSGTEYSDPPEADQLEVTLIGPGYGEAILIHIGGGTWITIDSCIAQDERRSAALRYLDDIQASPNNVQAIIASHWDDDHTRGLAELVESCPNADVIISKAFGRDEFLAYASAFDSPIAIKLRSGVREMRRTMHQLSELGRKPKAAGQNLRIYSPADINLSHGLPVELWTLSPATSEYENFLMWIASQMPTIKEPRRLAVNRKSNDLSTVVYLSIGGDAMLFGGDLEEEGNAETGWSAIIGGTGRPEPKAALFKIAHHGSKTGDHPGIWNELLEADPTVFLAPWKLGKRRLPTTGDVARILSHTTTAYASMTLTGAQPRRRDTAVERTIREFTKSFASMPQRPGMVRFRKQVGESAAWDAECFGGAVHLSAAYR